MDILVEYADSRGLTLSPEKEKGILRGVKILGLKSRNGRTYSPEALAGAAGLYEGTKVNVNHPRGNPTAARDYQDRIGAIRNVKQTSDGLFADFHFNPKHALAEQLVWDAEHSPENVGFSHNVEARVKRNSNGTTVEAITKVQSVDLVADPATTKGLFESESDKQEDVTVADTTLKEVTLESLKADRPELLEQFKTELAEADGGKAKDAQIVKLTTDLKEAVEKLAGQEHAATVVKELEAAKISVDQVSEVFRDSLLAEKDGEKRKSLIEDRVSLLKAAASGRKGPKSDFPHTVSEGDGDGGGVDWDRFQESLQPDPVSV